MRLRRILFPLTTISFLTYTQCSQQKSTSTSQSSTSLLFKSRQQHLNEMAKSNGYDVIVIGGGCNGVGVTLDAATRGLKTLIIQKQDFGSGASSKSTKLIHGGVRYLQQVFSFDFTSISSRLQKWRLVRQAIQERSLMIESAPHLTTKSPFVIPCKNLFQAVYYYVGSFIYFMIYKWYAPQNSIKFNLPYFLNRTELTDIFPHINNKYSMGVVYEDGTFNDSRLLMMALLTATTGNGLKMPDRFKPATAINRCKFIKFNKDNEDKIVGVVIKDQIQNKQYIINAKYVVNCCGAFADQIRLSDDPTKKKRIVGVAGSHITYDKKIGSGSYGIIAPSADGRIIIMSPWLGRIVAGTTQRKLSQISNNPTCSEKERKFISNQIGNIMGNLKVELLIDYQKTRWCGIRPLVTSGQSKDTKQIARSHVIQQSKSGLISLMGGKWTTYRRMGEDVVDLIAEKQSKKGNQIGKSNTRDFRLLGWSDKSLKDKLVKQYMDMGYQIYNNFGGLSEHVTNKKKQLNRIFGSISLEQLQWIVQNQLVTTIQDILMRRNRLCFVLGKEQTLSIAPLISKLLQKKFNWSQEDRIKALKKSIDNLLSYEFD